MDKDNANPTILNPQDLPSRRTGATLTASPRPRPLFASLTSGIDDDPSAAASGILPATWASSSNTAHETVEGDDFNDSIPDAIDAQEIYDLIAPITDPEHPLSLGSLGVVNLQDIHLVPGSSSSSSTTTSRITTVTVFITPTTSACSLTTVIGLGVKVRLQNALPPRFRIDVRVKPGSSASADDANKQLADKERVAAAMENRNLATMVNTMLQGCA